LPVGVFTVVIPLENPAGTDTAVRLYLQETFTFLLLTSEVAVALAPPGKAKTT
jgi:uncharacterized linocin/CFP29 family protein